MTDALKLFALFAVGVAFGWWLNGRGPTARRWVVIVIAILIGVPLALLAVAIMISHETLAWIGGLSLMVIGAAAVPLVLGALLGRALAPRKAEPAKDSASMKRDTPASAGPVPPRSPGLSASQRAALFAAAGVASGFWVVIALGFRLHGQPAPAGLDQGLIPAVLVFIATVSLGLHAIWRRRGWRVPVFSARNEAREQAEAMAKRQAWLAAMAADPRRQRYATMIEAGDNFWTPERVDYDLDPHATACCEHFAPIESAMRAAGLKVRLAGPSTVSAECVVDPDALARKFSLPEGIGFQEWYSRDRSGDDPPHALLFCAPHYSRVWVVHAREAAPGTPVFPSAS
jgi:hypothetical protein